MDFDSLDIRIDLDKVSDFGSLENRNMESIRSRQPDFDSLEVQDTEVLMLHRQLLQSFLTSDPAKLLIGSHHADHTRTGADEHVLGIRIKSKSH